jgi:hypothetical protein
MKDIPLTSIQIMMSSDELAYDLGLIPTPQVMENSKIITYIIFGMFVTVSLGLLAYNLHQIHQEKKLKFDTIKFDENQ